MAKVDMSKVLQGGLGRTMAAEKAYTEKRFEDEPSLAELRAAARNSAAAPAPVLSAPSEPEREPVTDQGTAVVSVGEASPERRKSAPRTAKRGRVDPKRGQVERMSYNLTPEDNEVIMDAVSRAYRLRRQVNKSVIIRAALQALAKSNDTAFLDAVDSAPVVARGRPIKDQ